MSEYSETMGSFIRTGNYPLEADYIFSTEAELKEFYEDPINATTLHKGLLKVVESDETDSQALYWVVETDDGLEFVKLISSSDTSDLSQQLQELSDKLSEFIENQDETNEAIWGTSNPLTIDTDLNSIKDLSDAISTLKEQIESNTNTNLQTELDQTQTGVGLNSDGSFSPDQETTYLKNSTSIMDALKTLDNKISNIETTISDVYDGSLSWNEK